MYYSHLRREHRPPRSHLLRPEHGPETRSVHPQAETRAVFALLGLCDLSLQARNVLFEKTLERARSCRWQTLIDARELARGLKQLGTFRQHLPFSRKKRDEAIGRKASSRDRTMSLVVLRHVRELTRTDKARMASRAAHFRFVRAQGQALNSTSMSNQAGAEEQPPRRAPTNPAAEDPSATSYIDYILNLHAARHDRAMVHLRSEHTSATTHGWQAPPRVLQNMLSLDVFAIDCERAW